MKFFLSAWIYSCVRFSWTNINLEFVSVRVETTKVQNEFMNPLSRNNLFLSHILFYSLKCIIPSILAFSCFLLCSYFPSSSSLTLPLSSYMAICRQHFLLWQSCILFMWGGDYIRLMCYGGTWCSEPTCLLSICNLSPLSLIWSHAYKDVCCS